ncbi:Protein MAEA-like protein [Bienertia sinuspersici]
MEIDPLPNGNSTTAVGSSSDAITGGEATAAMAEASASKATQLSDSLKLEHQFLRVPFEHYKKTIRCNHRSAEKEVSAVISSVDSASPDLNRDDAVSHLSSLVSRLQGLKRKICTASSSRTENPALLVPAFELEEGSVTESLQAQRCRARLNHLEAADAENLSEWSNTRLKRILVDYMLRMSYYESAAKLAETSNIQDLVDIDVFHEARRVIEALQNKSVAPALAWCADNKSKLKKSKPPRPDYTSRPLQDIAYPTSSSDVYTIVLPSHKSFVGAQYVWDGGAGRLRDSVLIPNFISVYSTLYFPPVLLAGSFESKQWDHLVDQFKQEFFRFYGMTLEPLLNIYLQAGLSALKTPYPLLLLFDFYALEDMSRRNHGKITCPRSGAVCKYSELVRAFIS